MSNKEQLQTIDLAALAQVSGGTTTTPTAGGDQVLTALTGILDSIKSLATQHNSSSGGFNQQEMLMFMMVMQQRNQQQTAVAATGAWPWSQDPIVRYY
jgi:hypothetical protein